ncbi:MAG: PP2C family protein-serine/threonine phosphatase [Anaerolineae bacterium]
MELNQLINPGQVEHLLESFAELMPLALAVQDTDGNVLAATGPAGVPADSAPREAQTPIDIHGQQVGHVVVTSLDPERVTTGTVDSVTGLISEMLADQVYKEHELNSLSTELLGKYEEVTLLYDLSQALGSVFDIPTICNIALDKAVQAVPATKAFIMLLDEGSEQLTVVAARVDGLVGWQTQIGRGISGWVAASGKPILLHEGEPIPSDTAEEESPRDAVLAVPLTLSAGQGEDQVLGVMTLAGRPPGEMFTAGDAKLLTTIATQAATAIHNSRLVEALREAERVKQEMEIAARIQQSLLPDDPPPPQLIGVVLAGYCIPAANVGGDYYDFLTDNAGRVNLLIADVSGHSVGSALMMAMARSILRREISQGSSPAAVLADTNTAMLHDLTNAGLFITMFCARYDSVTRRLTFANGGHNPPFLRRADEGEILSLDGDGMIVGILDDVVYEEQSITLQPGDLMVLYTDGIVEARNPDGEQFGEERLRGLLEECGSLAPGTLADRIYEAVREHSQDTAQQDDITLLILKVQEDS